MVRGIGIGKVECVWPLGADLGESPLWSPAEEAVYFIDINAPAIHRLAASEQRASWPMPEAVAALALRRGGGLIAAFRDGVFAIDIASGRRTLIADPEPGMSGNRLNDGRCDSAGRFWVGSMDEAEKSSTGALHRIDADGSTHLMDAGYIVANGPAFSPDGGTLYESDTMTRTIHAFDVDAAGNLGRKREFARFGDGDGCPDGLTVDAEGGVWAGGWNGWALTRFTPDGEQSAPVRLPTANVTASAFGGRDLKRLYITTARNGLSAAECLAQPLAGGLFAVDVDVPGMLTTDFAMEIELASGR